MLCLGGASMSATRPLESSVSYSACTPRTFMFLVRLVSPTMDTDSSGGEAGGIEHDTQKRLNLQVFADEGAFGSRSRLVLGVQDGFCCFLKHWAFFTGV